MRTSDLKWLLAECFGGGTDKSIFAPRSGIGKVHQESYTVLWLIWNWRYWV